MQYKVIWFDDEHAKPTLQHIPKLAQRAGIDLVAFASAEAGNRELDRAAEEYQAVILDGLFYDKEGQAGDTMDETALNSVLLHLSKLSNTRKLKAFILSGQTAITEKGNMVLKAHKVDRVYDKSDEMDYEALWRDIKAAADELPDTQIRHRYQRVFEVCTDKYIGDGAVVHLLEILRNANGEVAKLPDDLYFNHLRHCLEWLFRSAKKKSLLHEKCINAKGEVNLRCSSLYMAGFGVNLLQVRSAKTHFPPLIADHVRHLLNVTNAHSHTESWDVEEDQEVEKSKLRLESYREVVKSPYLLFSLTFMLMDVLLWYKQYADEHPDVIANKALWQNLEIEESVGEEEFGTVLKKELNDFAFFQPDSGSENTFIPPRLTKGLVDRMRVAVRTKMADKGPVVTDIRHLPQQ